MVSNGNNRFDQLSETYEGPVEIKTELSFNNCNPTRQGCDEPLIKVKIEESGDGDPLFTDELEDLDNGQISLDRNSHINPPQTYSNRKSKDTKKIKILSELPLKSMLLEALEAMPRQKGCGSRDVKKFIAKKYGIEFKLVQISQELLRAVETGELLQIRRSHSRVPLRRYRLTNLNQLRSDKLRAKRNINNVEDPTSLDQFISIDVKEESMLSYLEDTKELVFDNSMNRSSRESEENGIIHSGSLAAEEIKSETLLANVSSLESAARKRDDSISADEIGFMVLHALCSPPNPNGMRLDEIADFIFNFYNMDKKTSLPCIEKYLIYSIEKGILFKIGDRYKKSFATSTSNSKSLSQKGQMKSYTNRGHMDRGTDVGNKMENTESRCSQHDFFSSYAKLETVEVELSSSEIVPKQRSMKVKKRKYKRKETDFKLKTDVSTFRTAKNKLPRNNFKQQKRLAKFHDIYETTKRYVSQGVEYDSLSSGGTESSVVRNGVNKELVSELKVSWCPNYDPYRKKLNTRHGYNLRIKQASHIDKKKTSSTSVIEDRSSVSGSEFDCNDESDVKFDVRYTLDEIKEYISQYPEILSYNSPALMRDVSWERFSLTNEVSCLRLIGNTILSDESLYCNICASELQFGLFYCDVCSTEMENIILKCNICSLICNRGDVFYKHFSWEHEVLTEEIDYEAPSVLEKNIEKSLRERANDNKYQCGLCVFIANNEEILENHIVCMHMSTVTVFPPLPKENFPGELVILQNEITHGCCHECNGCKFICNRRDSVFYHILDAHKPATNDCYNDQFSSCVFEPTYTRGRDKPKWSFGLCYVCGNFYNNLSQHLERHGLMSVSSRLDMNVNKSNQEQNTSPLGEQNQSIPSAYNGIIETIRPKRKYRPGRPFLCYICGKFLKCKLWQHMRIHNNKNYDCNVCGRPFNRYSNLVTHRRVHTREKPYQCDICKMRFGYKCSIKGHIVNVHSETVT